MDIGDILVGFIIMISFVGMAIILFASDNARTQSPSGPQSVCVEHDTVWEWGFGGCPDGGWGFCYHPESKCVKWESAE